MNVLKIDRGNVEIRDARSGAHVRTIFQFGDAVSADFNANQTLIAITRTNKTVEIRDAQNGAHIKSIGNGNATNARWIGDDIAVTTTSGTVELRDTKSCISGGTLIRIM